MIIICKIQLKLKHAKIHWFKPGGLDLDTNSKGTLTWPKKSHNELFQISTMIYLLKLHFDSLFRMNSIMMICYHE